MNRDKLEKLLFNRTTGLCAESPPHRGGFRWGIYKLPRISCSLSIASNNALKFPLPKDFAPQR